MNVAFITTVRHNIGDDFVREGLEHLLTRALGRRPAFAYVHKHRPSTARLGCGRVRSERLDRWLERLPLVPAADRLLRADVVVQSGAPIYWCHPGLSHCADNEWFGPLVRRRLRRSRRRRTLVNLAGGACQRYHDDSGTLCERCAPYARELHEACALTTVRDPLAAKMAGRLGLAAPEFPCSSLFGPDNRGLRAEPGEYVVANYMPLGGHYDFGQQIDAGRWRETFAAAYRRLRERERVVLACHDAAELAAARALDPSAEVFMPRDDAVAAMRFYARAKYGLMNRVHGAMILAAFGRPSVVVGNDSRARMVDALGLPRVFVGDATAEALDAALAGIAASPAAAEERLLAVKREAERGYLEALRAVRWEG